MRQRYAPSAIPAQCAQLLADRHFHWAIIVALPIWLAGFLWFAPHPQWDWPLRHPRELLYLGLIYPVIEELTFRGLLQGLLRRQDTLRACRFGVSGANAITSLVFTAMHFIAHPPLAALAVVFPSLIFGYFRDRHGSLCAPIALHVYYNVGYFWIFAA